MLRFVLLLIVAWFVSQPLHADDTTMLTSVVRQLLIKNLPTPALTTTKNWDKQKEVTVRVNAERQGPFRWKLEPVKETKNDGLWSRAKVTIVEPDKNLRFEIQDVATPETGKTTFTAIIAGPVNFQLEQQMWKMGVRLYSGETRGRCEAKTVLSCESISRTDWQPGKLLPSQILKVTIAKADVSYEKFKVEHTAGVGGEAAEKIGDTVVAAIKLIKPNLEADLMEKANRAIVKAGQSKEVKLDFDKLLSGSAGK